MDFNPGKISSDVGKILLSGASGMLGSAIADSLERRGHSVLRLVRHPPASAGEIRWDPGSDNLAAARLEGIAAAIHLSGAHVAEHRWTAG